MGIARWSGASVLINVMWGKVYEGTNAFMPGQRETYMQHISKLWLSITLNYYTVKYKYFVWIFINHDCNVYKYEGDSALQVFWHVLQVIGLKIRVVFISINLWHIIESKIWNEKTDVNRMLYQFLDLDIDTIYSSKPYIRQRRVLEWTRYIDLRVSKESMLNMHRAQVLSSREDGQNREAIHTLIMLLTKKQKCFLI